MTTPRQRLVEREKSFSEALFWVGVCKGASVLLLPIVQHPPGRPVSLSGGAPPLAAATTRLCNGGGAPAPSCGAERVSPQSGSTLSDDNNTLAPHPKEQQHASVYSCTRPSVHWWAAAAASVQHTMPGIIVFQRRWSVGSDDLVVPGISLSLLHGVW